MPRAQARAPALSVLIAPRPSDCRLENERDLNAQLLNGFTARFHDLLPRALNATERIDSTTLNAKLTLRERQISDAGRRACKDFDKWASQKSKMEHSELVRRKSVKRTRVE